MENEIKVGDFIRTDEGEINRITEILNDDSDVLTYYCFENNMGTLEKSIVKHSSNLIDLIELGDVGEFFMEDDIDEEDTDIFEIVAISIDKKELGTLTKDFEIEFFPVENLRKIYTKEMMESISYKVKE